MMLLLCLPPRATMCASGKDLQLTRSASERILAAGGQLSIEPLDTGCSLHWMASALGKASYPEFLCAPPFLSCSGGDKEERQQHCFTQLLPAVSGGRDPDRMCRGAFFIMTLVSLSNLMSYLLIYLSHEHYYQPVPVLIRPHLD